MLNQLSHLRKNVVNRLLRAVADQQVLIEQTSPSTKLALKNQYLNYRSAAASGEPLPSVWDVGLRVFSQFDEDGIILFLLGVLGTTVGKFVDIGGGDGVWASNCANLALNFGFHGLFIDSDEQRVRRGHDFYGRHPDTSLYPPRFVHASVTRANVNETISSHGFEGEIDLVSIDIDGNDYWIWEAISVISPRIVVIEAHVEFGMNSIVVPYSDNFAWQTSGSKHYLGASPVALNKLANRLGYRLVGANRFGFNLFFLRTDLAKDQIPEIDIREALRHDRNKERMKIFEQIKDLAYETV